MSAILAHPRIAITPDALVHNDARGNGCLAFDVASEAVSFHCPLQRFIAGIILLVLISLVIYRNKSLYIYIYIY